MTVGLMVEVSLAAVTAQTELLAVATWRTTKEAMILRRLMEALTLQRFARAARERCLGNLLPLTNVATVWCAGSFAAATYALCALGAPLAS